MSQTNAPTRIAFCVGEGTDRDARLHERYARCERFVVIDRASGDTLHLTNSAASQAQGAAIAATAQLQRASVDAVVAHHFGPKALQALRRLGIAPYLGAPGTSVRHLLSDLEAGNLRPAS